MENEVIKNLENKNPRQVLKSNLDNMYDGIKDTLSDINDDDEIRRLKEQARILNKVMHCMLEGADTNDRNIGVIKMGYALRAQNQYRQTVVAAHSMNSSIDKMQERNLERHLEELNNRGTNYTNDPYRR